MYTAKCKYIEEHYVNLLLRIRITVPKLKSAWEKWGVSPRTLKSGRLPLFFSDPFPYAYAA